MKIKDALTKVNPQAAYREGMKETPERVLKAWAELNQGVLEDPDDLVKVFPVGEDGLNYDQMICFFNIPFTSLCEHHLMPFHGVAHIAYIPDKYIIGASKPARLLDLFATQFQIQERITVQLADFLYKCQLKPKGVMVVLEATHTCMTCRGVKKPGSRMLTSAIRGCFKQPSVKAEFLELIRIAKLGGQV